MNDRGNYDDRALYSGIDVISAVVDPVEQEAGGRQQPVLDSMNNLQGLVDHLGASLGNPTIMVAPDFKLIAYSRHTEEVDKARQLTILHRRAPERVIKLMHESGIITKMNAAFQPVRLPRIDEVGLGERVVMPIRVGDRLLGNISVQETHRALIDEDLHVLQQAAILAAIEFLRIGQHQESQHYQVSGFLQELLAGTLADEKVAFSRAQALGIQLPPAFQVAAVGLDAQHPGRLETSETNLRALHRHVVRLAKEVGSRIGVNPLYLIRIEMVILIVGYSRDAAIRHVRCDAFGEELRRLALRHQPKLSVSVGSSGMYEGLAQMPRALQEAERTLLMGGLCGWTDFAAAPAKLGALQLLPLFADAFRAHGSARGLHRRVEGLVNEAGEGGLNFPALETLEAYLDCSGDTVAAAMRLCIHPNSLNYRLRRITERVGLDLHDGVERLAIHLELKMRRLAGWPQRGE